MPHQSITALGRVTAALLALGIASVEVDAAPSDDTASAERASRPIATPPAPTRRTTDDLSAIADEGRSSPVESPPRDRQAPAPLGLCDGS